MENKYSNYNNILGWLVWLFATTVFVLTVEPTASFWDCGEFIAAGVKQQVGHPPGAPLWLMIARVFSLFAGDDVMKMAYMVNIFSALCSSFTILFLFWSITAFGKKVAAKAGELTTGNIISILGSGLIGALVYTFSDSFWFSAVEGEVYAASSFSTALVFWLLLKWDANADKPFSDRYLILVAYVMGLSIGVHILNLLAIPALVYIYYFRRFNTSTKGFIYAGLISVAMLGVIQYGIISSMVSLATKFEIFFTNSFGLPYNSGMWIYFVLVGVAIFYGIKYSSQKRLPNLQNAVYGVLVILIGYSSFAMIVVRSAANPPMDENNPENIVNLLPYLNREQYGDRPLFYGQSFNSELDSKEPYTDGDPVYYRSEDGKKDIYKVADERKGNTPNYNSKTCMYFPRMHSSQGHHVSAYEAWTNFEGKKVRIKVNEGDGMRNKIVKVPTFSENIQFFFSYQVNFMYWRYFMWNFTGRQNDIQGNGLGKDKLLNGNWLSGVDFIDNEHLGDQKSMPASIKENPGRNAFYFLPLILGILGMMFHFSKNWKDAFSVLLLFFMTGMAIVIYLNQTPYQPRERDYAYAGSFYAFAIWIGLGVQALFSFMLTKTSSTNKESKTANAIGFEAKLKTLGLYEVALAILFLLALGVMFTFTGSLTEGYSFLYIGAVCAAIVAGCLLLGKVLHNQTAKALLVLTLSLYVPYKMAADGWNDHDRSNRYTARDFAKNYLASCAPNAIIFTNGDNDTFPLWYVQDVEGYRTDVRVVNLSLLNTDWYIDQMKRKAYDSKELPISFEQFQYRQGTRDYVYMKKELMGYQDITKMMDFVKSDNPNNQLRMSNNTMLSYLPADSLSVPVDRNTVLKNGTVLPEFAALIPKSLDWALPGGAVLKAKMVILDIMSKNNWERPIYFAITVGDDNYMNLEEYFQLEGLAYRVTPIKHAKPESGETGWINTDAMYDNLMNKFQWGNMEKPGVYLDEQVQRMCMNYRNNFARLAKTLVDEKHDTLRAIKVLDKCVKIMPQEKVPYNFFSIYLADAYLKCGEFKKGNAIMLTLMEQYYNEMLWYADQNDQNKELLNSETERGLQAIQTIGYFASRYQQKVISDKAEAYIKKLAQANIGN